jgi:hypothetical protein
MSAAVTMALKKRLVAKAVVRFISLQLEQETFQTGSKARSLRKVSRKRIRQISRTYTPA